VSGGPVLLLYQMGKVGSSTMFASLRAAGYTDAVKVHYLSDQGLARADELYAAAPVRLPVPYRAETERIRELLRSRRHEVEWKVISLVREPIARDVSALIQMVDMLRPDLVQGGTPDVRAIVRAVRSQFLGFSERRSYTCRWFDDELRAVFGIDVFGAAFDPGPGWMRLKQDHVDLLVLRLESLDETIGPATAEFLGAPIQLVRHSSRSDAKLQAAYRKPWYDGIVSGVRLPRALCQRIYESRYSRHFYSADERGQFTERWAADEGKDS
jgi:Putative capsular polysaccharide synthesis protein